MPQAATLAPPGGALIQTSRVDGYKPIALASLAVAATIEKDVGPHASADGRLVAHFAGGYVELFDTMTRRDIWTVQCADDYPVVQVALTPDARYVAAAAGYWMERKGADAVHVWHVESKREVFAVARGGIQTFLISPDGLRIVMGMHRGSVELWNVVSGERIAGWECGQIAAMA